ncbi:hypothetical protein [Streptomyces sp. NPDC047841]
MTGPTSWARSSAVIWMPEGSRSRNLRTLMRRETGITPSVYKRRFGPEAN